MMEDNDGVWPEEDEGLFDDDGSIFGSQHHVDTDNPLIDAVEDTRMHSPPAAVQGTGIQQSAALVAVFDEQGLPMVAKHVMRNGRPEPLENFRRPTEDEYNSIMFGGKIVRGGVVAENVPTTTNLQPTMMRTPLGQVEGPNWKKIGLYGGVGAALLGAGWYGWRWWRNR